MDRLHEPTKEYSTLQNGFWPQTRWISHTTKDAMGLPLSNVADDIVEEHYCGPRNGRSKTTFDPIIHVRKGMFLLIQPNDEDVYPTWLGEALGDIELNPQSPQY